MASLYQLIYTSRPFGYDQPTLDGILLDARRCNERDSVTGALICRRDVFLQLLEGTKEIVSNTYERIRRDDRHVDVRLRYFGDIDARLFGRWAMLHDPANSWLWREQDIANGVLESIEISKFRRVFEALAKNVA